MKIKREIDGKEFEFELTPQELYEAFAEQEFQFDLESVRCYFEDYSDDDLYEGYTMTREELEASFEDIAVQLRRNIDKYDMSYEYALPAAVSDVLCGERRTPR